MNLRMSWMATAALALTGCAGEPELGPKDGFDLPPIDLERIRIGEEAPDFSLRAFSGNVITLSEYRGDKNVILVFYRGHW